MNTSKLAAASMAVVKDLRVILAVLTLVAAGAVSGAPAASATSPEPPTSTDFCSSHGSSLVGVDRSANNTVWTFRGVPACKATENGSISYRGALFSSPNGFQCIEYANRYFYVITGKSPAIVDGHLGNGRDIAANIGRVYGKYYHVTKPTSRYASSLVSGDIISMWGSPGTESAGHVAVVTKVSLIKGSGKIFLIDENGAAPKYSYIRVNNGIMTYARRGSHYYYTNFQWVYGLPGTALGPRPKQQTLPDAPTGTKVASTTNTSAKITWNDASNNEDGFVSQYRIGSGPWTRGPSVGANVASLTVRGLKASTSYTFQVGARNSKGTHWSAYAHGATTAEPAPPSGPPAPPAQPAPPGYHAGFKAAVDRHATGGVSGHMGPGNAYRVGPTRVKGASVWIVCYVAGQSITGPYGTTAIWDLSDDGYYYADAWIFTGSNSAVVPRCAQRPTTVDKHAMSGLSGHTGPSDRFNAGPTHSRGTTITLMCYVSGQDVTGPYGTTNMWDLAADGYYYTDAWIYTGSNSAVIPRC